MSDPTTHSTSEPRDYDFIIVGSGAGGGPLAARLAEAGQRVLVLEAGPRHTSLSATDPANEVTRVPALHAVSTEHPDVAWRFFVEHFRSRPDGTPENGRIARDPKWHDPEAGETEQQRGIFYPRATGVGGCTIHNAMITIAGPDSDWDEIAEQLQDPSWSGTRMRSYFQRIEHNDYLPLPVPRVRFGLGVAVRYLWTSVRWALAALPQPVWLLLLITGVVTLWNLPLTLFTKCWATVAGFVAMLIGLWIGRNPDPTSGRHGFEGWLHTSTADLKLGLSDPQLLAMLKAALKQSRSAGLGRAWSWVGTFLQGRYRQSLDPNHYETQEKSPEGVVLIPLSVHGSRTNIAQNAQEPNRQRGRRSSPRERLHAVEMECRDRLEIRTGCLVTRVLLDDSVPPRATGVEYLRGERLYRACVNPQAERGQPETVHVRPGGEVILCGGTFNTPQLLMLSGIGPRTAAGTIGVDPGNRLRTDEDSWSVDIPCRVDLPGVGRNLTDRYEVSVVSNMKEDFRLLDGAELSLPASPQNPDERLREWRSFGTGLYSSNGGVLGIFKRSQQHLAQPDLFIFGVPFEFRGYEVGYSRPPAHNKFTWIVLKSHSRSSDGTVRLRSMDPLDTPLINFHLFRELTGSRNSTDPDVAALAEGVKFVRGILKRAWKVVSVEHHPGVEKVPQGNDDRLHAWIRSEAWGHHACGTCRMGAAGDSLAVLDSRFRVRGVSGLRVVDASVFPRIPGYFIVTNVYMASEKAADVILEDVGAAKPAGPVAYPAELFERESQALNQRRRFVVPLESGGGPNNPGDAGLSPVSDTVTSRGGQQSASGNWSDDVSALALSGGGIRSATICLGALQSLARAGWLRRLDFLSTVSGGGYIGSFLGRCYDRLRPEVASGRALVNPVQTVEQALSSDRSPEVSWLRKHGNYLAPQGQGDGRLNFAVFVRNLLSVHLVTGLALFALFGLVNGLRYSVIDRVLAVTGLAFDCSDLPVGHLVSALFGPFSSPWFLLVELLLLFMVIPLIAGYWIVSEDKHQSFKRTPLLVMTITAALLLFLGVRDGLKVELVLCGMSLLTSLIYAELAWRRGDRREAAVGSGSVETQRARTRNYLTYDLGMALALTGTAAAFVVVDSLGHGLQEWIVAGSATYAGAFAGLLAAIMTAMPVIRYLTGLLTQPATGQPSTIVRILKREMVPALLAVVLMLLLFVFYSFAAHAAFGGGVSEGLGWSVTAAALAVTLCFALPPAVSFVNRSSLAQTYGARLARAFLGASNPLRQRPDGRNVTEVIPGDDVAAITDYQPHRAGGPLHVLNLTINQTVDSDSYLANRDRQGESLAVSCLGVTVGESAHGLWEPPAVRPLTDGRKHPMRIRPAGWAKGQWHPLVDLHGEPADQVEMLSLRQWVALSGAAIDPGRGRSTRPGTALLMGLVNMRTGHWWDTSISHADRCGWPDLTFFRRLLYLVPRLFTTQSLVLFEWFARFPGITDRFWHLSDGGFFENLGAYELIRRRVPRIIVCDCGADPKSEFEDLAELTRKVRIDFGASIVPYVHALPATGVTVPQDIGTLDDLRPVESPPGPPKSRKHAALFSVTYADNPRQRSLLLYVKATVTGDESQDIGHYHTGYREFPHEATADQFFDEPQWESHRALGEHIVAKLTSAGGWFWNLPL